MSSESTAAKRSGITNSSFVKDALKLFPMFKWAIGIIFALIFAYMTMYIRLNLFTKSEGTALKEASYTKAEAKELESEVEENSESIDLIERKFEIFEVEQKYHTQKLDTILEKVEALH